MGGFCQWCDVGGYYDCGPANHCVGPGDILEDRMHTLRVYLRRRGDCLEAKLWPQGAGNPPGNGWKLTNTVPVRVQTFYAGGEPVGRVYVQKSAPDKPIRCSNSIFDEDYSAEIGGKVKITIHVD